MLIVGVVVLYLVWYFLIKKKKTESNYGEANSFPMIGKGEFSPLPMYKQNTAAGINESSYAKGRFVTGAWYRLEGPGYVIRPGGIQNYQVFSQQVGNSKCTRNGDWVDVINTYGHPGSFTINDCGYKWKAGDRAFIKDGKVKQIVGLSGSMSLMFPDNCYLSGANLTEIIPDNVNVFGK